MINIMMIIITVIMNCSYEIVDRGKYADPYIQAGLL